MTPHLVAPCCALLRGCWKWGMEGSAVGCPLLICLRWHRLSVCPGSVSWPLCLLTLTRCTWKGDASASSGCPDSSASESWWGPNTFQKLHGCTALGQACTHLEMQCQTAGRPGDSTWLLPTHRPELQGQGGGHAAFLPGALLPNSLGVFHEDIDLILKALLLLHYHSKPPPHSHLG